MKTGLNLAALFDMQRKLDEHIEKEHPRQDGEDRLAKKILALVVELGELANEWRGFKFWSNDQKPRTELWKDCNFCGGRGFVSPANYPYGHQRITCIECRGESQFKTNPLLEEYVDCLHFILSIGNDTISETGKVERFIHPKKMPNILDQFMWTNKKIVDMYEDYRDKEIPLTGYHFTHVFSAIWGLGEMLGFTWEQIEEAYMKKNVENHRRQEVGY